MPASPRSAHVSAALDALTTSKPTVLDAVAHLTADLPRARLLSLRLAPSVANATEARRMVDALGSAALLEHFSAMPFELAGACDEALEVRLDALRIAPRYDPWLCARILAGATRCLLKARRHDEARATASRALAFLPGDPTALSLLAAVEEATGNAARAHAIWARLRDDGYAPPLVAEVAPDVEREIVPFSIRLDALEPMSDDELADYLVYARLDVSATDAPLQPRRHAANLLRRGDPGGARVALCRAADWECLATRSMYWMGVAVDQDDMAANEALLAAIEATPEGARARSLSEKRGLVSRFSLAIPTRQEALRTLVAAGTVDEAARLIADWTFSVRLEAMAALPAHPTSVRVAALAAQADPSLPVEPSWERPARRLPSTAPTGCTDAEISSSSTPPRPSVHATRWRGRFAFLRCCATHRPLAALARYARRSSRRASCASKRPQRERASEPTSSFILAAPPAARRSPRTSARRSSVSDSRQRTGRRWRAWPGSEGGWRPRSGVPCTDPSIDLACQSS